MFQYLFPHRDTKRAANRRIVEQAVALLQAQARIDYLLRIIHDLRSPLTTIENALPLLERQYTAGSHLQSIKSASHYAVSLVSKAFWDTEVAELQQVCPEPLQLKVWLYEMLEMKKTTADLYGVILKEDIRDDLPDYILADQEILTRMMMNLLDNAIAYSPPNEEIMIACYEHEHNLTIQVTNKAKEKVPDDAFQPYVRGSAKGEGQGLGLAITRRLAEMHGGFAYSEFIPEGSRISFFVRIPLNPTWPDQVNQSYNDWPSVIETAGNGLHVLFIDDDEHLRPVIAANLISSSFVTKVTTVGGAKRAVEIALTSMPDVIITDDNLGWMSGVSVAEQLQRTAGTKGRPVIVISGSTLPESRRNSYIGLGVTEFVQKPFNPKQLEQAIQRTVAP